MVVSSKTGIPGRNGGIGGGDGMEYEGMWGVGWWWGNFCTNPK